ncbi:MAG: hypothetical protein N2449_01455 [Bacteroidales bacterium]|nr:hypothetical protein [Bacteroidales bacterium]
MKFKFSILLFLIFILLSCKKKDENYIISGKIINPETNVSVSSAKITLWGTKISSGIVQNQQEKLAELYSNTDGTFEIKFDKQVYSGLKMYIQKNGYFSTEKNINPNNLTPGSAYNVVIHFHAMSWLKTTVKNVGSQNASDQLTYKLSLPYNDCNDCCPTQQRVFLGTIVDTTWICPVYGGQFVSILWIYSNNLNSTPHNDTIFIPIGDTVAHPIFY